MASSLHALICDNTKSASRAAAYYTAGLRVQEVTLSAEVVSAMVGYYVEGGSSAKYYGRSAEKLGLSPGSSVKPVEMTRLLQLLDPHDRSRLPNNGGRKAKISALDLTFSFEKEVSTMWLLADAAGRREIEAMVDESVHAGVDFYQDQACVVTRGADGIVKKTASGFIAIETDHTTARPVDGNPPMPSLHRHFLMINAAEHEGKYTALDSRRLYNLQMVAGAIAGQRMRELMADRFDVSWEREKKGVHRIAGFDNNLRRNLSARSREILERVLADGGDPTSRGDMIKAQRDSRSDKDVCSSDSSNEAEIIEKLAQDGVTFTTILSDLHAAKGEEAARLEQVQRDRKWIDLTFPPCPSDVVAAQEWRDIVARELATIPTLSTLNERVHEAPPLQTFNPIPPAYDRLRAAMEYVDPAAEETVAHEIMMEVGRERSTWVPSELLFALCDHGISGVAAKAYADNFLKSAKDVTWLWGLDDDPDSVLRPAWSDQARFATTETLEKERQLVQATKDGLGARESVLESEEQFAQVLAVIGERDHLVEEDSDKYDMLRALLRGNNAIQIIEGQAGSTKSTSMLALQIAGAFGYLDTSVFEDGSDDAPLRVVGCALTARAAKLLTKNSGGIPAYSLTMLLSRLERGKIALAKDAIVVVDEVSQASTAHLHQLNEYIQAVGGRLVLAGDTRQLQSVGAGGLVRTLLRETPEAVVLMDETFRQKNVEERAVLAAIHYRGLLGTQPHAIQALLKQGVDQDFIGTLVGDGTQEAGLKAALGWYKSHHRIRIHASAEAATAEVAVRYWDVVTKSSKPIEDAVIITAKSNEEADYVNQAVVEEAVKRGILDAEAKVEFARRRFLKGERITLRAVDWDLGVLNGDSGTIDAVALTPYQWEIEYESPGPYAITRKSSRPGVVGETGEVQLSASAVASERVRAAKRLTQCKTTDATAKAQAWLEWASGLADHGGTVELVVRAQRVLKFEERLFITLDNGEERHLPVAYVEKHVGSGYVSTEHKGQGSKAEVSTSYNHMRYVGASRGTDLNLFDMIVEPNDDVIIETDRLALAEAYAWLSAQLGDESAQAVISANAAREFTEQGPLVTVLSDNVAVSMMSTTKAMNDRIAREIAEAHLTDERRVGVVRSRAMAIALNNAVVDQLKDMSGQRTYSPKIGESRWVKGMPVLVARGDVDGLAHGETYTVAALNKDSLILATTDGRRIEMNEGEVTKHLDPAFVVTAARAREGIGEVDKLIGAAPGLDREQLDQLAGFGGVVEIVVPDPDVSGALAWVKEMDKVMMDHLIKDAGTGWDSRSASDMLAWRQGEEVGLAALQTEIASITRVIDEARNLSPRELLIRDIERERIALRDRQKDLTEKVKIADNDEDRLDSQSGIARVEQSLKVADDHYQLAIGNLPDDDPLVAITLTGSVEHHEQDAEHLAEVEGLLRHFVQARVTAASKFPKPYHPQLSIEPELSAETAVIRRQEQIVAIEEYRARWGVSSYDSALGSDELEDGLRRDDYDRVSRLLSQDGTANRSQERSR
jgi:conjugative relaxase-like TrwC/TraI family protein